LLEARDSASRGIRRRLDCLHGVGAGAGWFAQQRGLHGVEGSTDRSGPLDHAREGIRVNVLCPGPIETPMLRRSIDRHDDSRAYEQMILDETPLGRIGRPQEIARAALFLLSDDSSYMTGSTVVADGGATAQ
jgi:NAD(P)-dependent dehydrogenase (short-subunit alcohol dehydrogenase family)